MILQFWRFDAWFSLLESRGVRGELFNRVLFILLINLDHQGFFVLSVRHLTCVHHCTLAISDVISRSNWIRLKQFLSRWQLRTCFLSLLDSEFEHGLLFSLIPSLWSSSLSFLDTRIDLRIFLIRWLKDTLRDWVSCSFPPHGWLDLRLPCQGLSWTFSLLKITLNDSSRSLWDDSNRFEFGPRSVDWGFGWGRDVAIWGVLGWAVLFEVYLTRFLWLREIIFVFLLLH